MTVASTVVLRPTSRGTDLERGIIDQITRWVHDQRTTWLPVAGRLDATPTILIGRRGGRATLAFFETDASAPSLMIKVAAVRGDLDPARREYDALRAMEATTTANDRERLHPRPFGILGTSTTTAIAMEAVGGERFSLVGVGRERPRRSTRRALQGFLTATEALQRSLDDHLADHGTLGDIAGPRDQACRLIEAAHLRPHAATCLTSRLRSLAADPPRWTPNWQHGDLAPGNVLRSAADLRAIDWEEARPDRYPWHDRCYVPLTLTRLVERDHPELTPAQALVWTLDPARWPGSAIAASLTGNWPFTLAISDAMLLTVLDLAERASQTSKPSMWVGYLDALLTDTEVHRRCEWIAPAS